MINLARTTLAAAAGSATADAILRALTRDTGEMCSFGVQVGDEVAYVASAEPPHELTVFFRAGRRAPLFCTSNGRLFLSRLDDEEVRPYRRRETPIAKSQLDEANGRQCRPDHARAV
jgi:DNA-binding IclR family transcriptional regulator